jgi:predicted nuclease of predicted toxin-antitoxin system
MRFLADQDVFAATARFLRDLEHDVVTAAEAGLVRASDVQLLAAAREQQRILVTRDRDFGALVFLHRLQGGVIYLRLAPSMLHDVHAELARTPQTHSEADLHQAFVTVEVGRHRFRRLPK